MTGLWISIVTWDVSTDVFVLGMAIPMVWRLNLKLRDKIMLTGVFMLGALVIIFSILSCSAIADGLERKDSEDNKGKFTSSDGLSRTLRTRKKKKRKKKEIQSRC